MKPAIRSKRRGVLKMKLFCFITTLYLIRQQRPLKRSENRNSIFSPIQRTVQISPHLITIFWECSEMRYVDADFQTMKRSRTRCTRGFASNRKPSSQMASGGSLIEVKTVWRSEGITCKNDSILMLHTFCRIMILNSPYFFILVQVGSSLQIF